MGPAEPVREGFSASGLEILGGFLEEAEVKESTMSRGAGSSRVRPSAQGWGSLFSFRGLSFLAHPLGAGALLTSHTHIFRGGRTGLALPGPSLSSGHHLG